jgi:HlyD family secretion protein
MSKTIRSLLLIVGGVAAAAAVLYGILLLVRNGSAGAVNVYSLSEIATSGMGSASQAYGTVKSDNLQSVWLSSTQQVLNIAVTEGQQVNVGDVLMTYDTTLSSLAVQNAKLALQKLQNQLATAKRELETLKSTAPAAPPEADMTPQTTPMYLSGSATMEDPTYYLWGSGDSYDEAFLRSLLPDGGSEAWVVCITRENNALGGEITGSFGLHIMEENGNLRFTLFQPTLPGHMTSAGETTGYTAAELARKRAQKEQEIRKLTISVEMARVEYETKKNELDNGSVVSKISGTVKTVRDPKDALAQNVAVIEVSAGGGYYVEAAISELELAAVTIGQQVSVQSWESNTTCEGTIRSVATEPTSGSENSGSGNGNVSYYPAVIWISEDARLREGETVSISYTPADDESGFYVENAFVRTENGSSYVYVRGEKGLLERRVVQTGKIVDGYYTQIRGGLTMDDYVAFPYGSNVRAGAKTSEATIDQLYSY